MTNSIHNAIWDWFSQCAYITKLFFNFSGTEDSDTVIATAGDMMLEEYIDGSQRRRYNFELIRYLPAIFSANDTGNILMMEDVETIVAWVKQQAANGNLPQLPDGYQAEDITALDEYAGVAVARDENTAKYLIPFALDYVKG